ncbi:MAG: small ribosomal subunit Rsm22 family protein [Sandaracinaceae bacterium]
MTWEAWVGVVDDLAPKVLGPADRRGQPLAAEVRRLSEVYTRERHALAEASGALAARLRFFFLRDLLKITGPLEELAGDLPAGPVWRVLDLGAGLGTTTLGLATVAKARGIERIEVTAVERDGAALDVFEGLAREGARRGLIPELRIDARRMDVDRLDLGSLRKADLVVAGLVLNELFGDRAEADRLDAAEAWLRGLVDRLAPGGSAIVLEPALKRQSRTLQTLRDRLAELVYAPCLRAGECPLLRRERDWCHAALPVELPEPLAALAAESGLRQSRLTYAYLTLRADGKRLEGHGDPRALRIVGGPVQSKGKAEWDACGEAGLVRLRRLDRERAPSNAVMDSALRGTVLRLAEAPADGADVRLRPGVEIARI